MLGALGRAMAERRATWLRHYSWFAIFSALRLYLNFVNLFQFLMMFMGQRR
jgi:FtsH-binding integral membrane protein